MALNAGRTALCKACATDGSFTTVSSMKLSNISRGYATVDSTAFADTAGRALPTLGLFSGSMSGLYNNGDTGQAIVRTAITNRATCWIQILLDGTNGWKCECSVTEDFKMDASGGVEYTINFTAAGGAAPTATGSP